VRACVYDSVKSYEVKGLVQRALRLVVVACGFGVATIAAQSSAPSNSDANASITIQAYGVGLPGACTASPGVLLSLGQEPATAEERVLIVEYPVPTKDPAGRDVRCAAENQDWSAGRAISFQIRPDQALRLSMSFIDRNRVVYTAWANLKGSVWQQVGIPFGEIRPNPFFQPPDAKTGAPLDVTDVKAIAFAPQDQTSGRFAIGKIVVSK
jgi:hypothetical protein